MSLSPALATRVQERDELLNRITSVLRADKRIAAAWLFGSLGRGTEDAVSDLDIWVVVHDAYLPQMLDDAYSVASMVGEPLYMLNVPYNGPAGGTSLNTAYDGAETGAHIVDCYLQGVSTAHRPPQLRLLFDHVGLPISAADPQFGNPGVERSETTAKVENIRFFWQMLLVCAKYVYRSPNEERMGLLLYPVNALNDVRQFLGQTPVLNADELPSHPTPAEKLAVLHSLADTMTACMPTVEQIVQTQGEVWQISPTLIPSTYRFLDFIETATK